MDFVRITSVECVMESNYYRKFLLVSFLPMIVLILALSVYLLPKYLQRKLSCLNKKKNMLQKMATSGDVGRLAIEEQRSRLAQKRSRRRFWRMLIYSLFLIYPSVSSTIIRLYVCRTIDGVSYLVEDFRLICYTPDYNFYAMIGIAMIFVYPIGIPAFLFYMLYQYRKRLDEPGVRAQLGFLFDGFHHEYWWFEIADMIHKLTLVSLLAFFPVKFQLQGGMAVLMGYACLILCTRPYLRKGDDRLHLLGQTEVFLLLLSGHVFRINSSYDKTIDYFLSIVFVIIFIAFFAYLVPQIAVTMFKLLVIRWNWLGERLAKRFAKIAEWREAHLSKKTKSGGVSDKGHIVQRRFRKGDFSDHDITLQRNVLHDQLNKNVQGNFTAAYDEVQLVENELFSTTSSVQPAMSSNPLNKITLGKENEMRRFSKLDEEEDLPPPAPSDEHDESQEHDLRPY